MISLLVRSTQLALSRIMPADSTSLFSAYVYALSDRPTGVRVIRPFL